MTRIAIIGGGISGLTAAYELELARKRGAPIDWHLYEASDRLGGIVETTRIPTSEGDYILEGGPDGWVTEKPWARELAIQLGLEDQLIPSNDATRKTYIVRSHDLLPIPDGMRLMVPQDLSTVDDSPLFSLAAKAGYACELIRADELKQQAPEHDESVASFVRRHFGEEVLSTLAAPLLSGVFGGDVHKLSVRAVMPQFVTMEREHGSLIAALQARAAHRTHAPQPIFTSLRRGMASIAEALIAELPVERLHTCTAASALTLDAAEWQLHIGSSRHADGNADRAPRQLARWGSEREPEASPYATDSPQARHFNHILLATPADVTRRLLHPINPQPASLLPTDASSAILAAFAWPPDLASTFTIPPGFGFLVPPSSEPTKTLSSRPKQDEVLRSGETPVLRDAQTASPPQLLACTFVDQKFPRRAPTGARILRAFFGGDSASQLAEATDGQVATAALTQLRAILGPLPDPTHTHIRRLPRSLPQYEVGHLDRIAELERLVSGIPGLHLLGNSYRGVGLPDLIRDARATAGALIPHP